STHGASIGARAWLGEGVGGEPFAGGELGDPLVLLLFGACEENGQRAKLLDAEDQGGGGVGLGQLLNRQEDGKLTGSEAAVLLGKGHGQDILLGEELLHVPRELTSGVYLGSARGNTLLGNLANHVQQHFLFGGQLNSHGCTLLCKGALVT